MEKVQGRHVDVRRDDGVVLRGRHLENLVELPLDVDDWERERAAAPDLDSSEPGGGRLSPGQLLERKAGGKVPLP
eukprot:2121558-Lingulodinium_polyedra.AAC.1